MGIGTLVHHHWDRLGAWSAIAVGAVAVLIGWLGISGSAFVFEQLPYVVSGGIGGLFLLGLGTTLLLSADLRDEWRKLDRIEHALLAEPGGSRVGSGTARLPGVVHDGLEPPVPAEDPGRSTATDGVVPSRAGRASSRSTAARKRPRPSRSRPTEAEVG